MIVQEIRNDNVVGYVGYQGEPSRKDVVIEKLRKQAVDIQRHGIYNVIQWVPFNS